jgi:hypothetical protein
MTRKLIFLTIIAMVVLMSLLVGCSSTPAETTPTPDTSIVWSDDFEDGDTEGWERWGSSKDEDFSVSEGILSFGSNGGIIRHPSTVTIGTWSFDVFLKEEFGGTPYEIDIMAGQNVGGYQTVEISNMPNTFVFFYGGEEPVFIDFGERLAGQYHFDVTRGEDLVTKVYMDGEFLIENYDDSTTDSEYFRLWANCEGPAFDNFVVRNQVIDIQPAE